MITHNLSTGTHTLDGRTIHYGDTPEASTPTGRWVLLRVETWTDGLHWFRRGRDVPWIRVTMLASARFRWPNTNLEEAA